MSLGDITRRLIKAEGTGGLRKELARYLEIPEGSEILDRFDWLGLTKDEPVPLKEGSALDALVEQLMKKLWFREGERDMIVLHHDFEVETEEGRQRITSTLVDYGIPGGDSAMARTVALPAAICTRLVLEGKLPLTGVHAPVLPVVYEPVLRELEDLGIKCREVVRGTVS
jgi:saccharopine dehydrogenase-like NADP-dependent oxidoreductase